MDRATSTTIWQLSSRKEQKQPSTLLVLAELLQELIGLLQKSASPLLLLGHQIKEQKLQLPLLTFAERYRVPFCTTVDAKGVVGERHPLFVGVLGLNKAPRIEQFIDSCDLVLILGAPPGAIEASSLFCSSQLLIGWDGTVAVGYHHYVAISLLQLLQAMAELKLNIRYRHDYPALIDWETSPWRPKEDHPIVLDRFIEALQPYLTTETLLVAPMEGALAPALQLVVEEGNFIGYKSSLPSTMASWPIQLRLAALPGKRAIFLVDRSSLRQTDSSQLWAAVAATQDPIVLACGGSDRAPLPQAKEERDPYRDFVALLLKGAVALPATDERELDRSLCEAFNAEGKAIFIEVELAKG